MTSEEILQALRLLERFVVSHSLAGSVESKSDAVGQRGRPCPDGWHNFEIVGKLNGQVEWGTCRSCGWTRSEIVASELAASTEPSQPSPHSAGPQPSTETSAQTQEKP
jgi:hypothetical protein